MWVFEEARRRVLKARFPFFVHLFSDDSNTGCEVPGRPPAGPIDLERYVQRFVDGRPNARRSPLERLVGHASNGLRLRAGGVTQHTIQQLATATQVPMGIELAPSAQSTQGESVTLTGLRLRDALDALVRLDPQFGWREMDGVVVIRPKSAWTDPHSALFTLVKNVHLEDARTERAVLAAVSAFRTPPKGTLGTFPDGNRFSVDLPVGTSLDLLNAVIRAH